MDNVAIMQHTHYESKFPLLRIHVAPFLKDGLLYGRLAYRDDGDFSKWSRLVLRAFSITA